MKQRGISLIVVLVALLIISFAAVALLRSSDTGTLVAGNLAFKKTALSATGAGGEVALNWLLASAAGNTLWSDITASGYFASSADGCDLTGTRTPGDVSDDVNWTGTDPGVNCNMDAFTPLAAPAGVPAGYTVRWVINRMCNAEGDPNAVFASDGVTPMVCSTAAAGASEGSTRGGGSYGNTPLTGMTQSYFRITTRVDGPRNTVRYAQAMVTM